MKKIQIITMLAITSFMFAQAQENEDMNQPQKIRSVMPAARQAINQLKREDASNMPKLTTGDANIDAQVQALNKEMEEKIKSIRDEYLAKIKAIVGDKKPILVRPSMMGTTTPPGMYNGEKRGFDEGNKLGRPMMGTTTERQDGDRPSLRDLIPKGEVRQDGTPAPQDFSPRVMNFFRVLFGGNN